MAVSNGSVNGCVSTGHVNGCVSTGFVMVVFLMVL